MESVWQVACLTSTPLVSTSVLSGCHFKGIGLNLFFIPNYFRNLSFICSQFAKFIDYLHSIFIAQSYFLQFQLIFRDISTDECD